MTYVSPPDLVVICCTLITLVIGAYDNWDEDEIDGWDAYSVIDYMDIYRRINEISALITDLEKNLSYTHR